MIGSDAHTGKHLSGDDHLRQSIADIITTPLGTRVMRRAYGSLLMQLIDQPFTAATAVRMYASIASALMQWEPRIRVRRIELQRGADPGQFTITVDVLRTDTPTRNTIQQFAVPLITPTAA